MIFLCYINKIIYRTPRDYISGSLNNCFKTNPSSLLHGACIPHFPTAHGIHYSITSLTENGGAHAKGELQCFVCTPRVRINLLIFHQRNVEAK